MQLAERHAKQAAAGFMHIQLHTAFMVRSDRNHHDPVVPRPAKAAHFRAAGRRQQFAVAEGSQCAAEVFPAIRCR